MKKKVVKMNLVVSAQEERVTMVCGVNMVNCLLTARHLAMLYRYARTHFFLLYLQMIFEVIFLHSAVNCNCQLARIFIHVFVS